MKRRVRRLPDGCLAVAGRVRRLLDLQPHLIARDGHCSGRQRFAGALQQYLFSSCPFLRQMRQQYSFDRFSGEKPEQFSGRKVRDLRYQKVNMLAKLFLQVVWTSEISRKYDPEIRVLNSQAVCLKTVGNRSAIESGQMCGRSRMDFQIMEFEADLRFPRHKNNFERDD